MKNNLSRKDFLKLAGLLPLSLVNLRLPGPYTAQQGQKNVLIIVLDAFSARNIPFYGYQRETTPNLSRLAERAIVYHNHYAGANFTTPGTASLLTGTLPWTHRAFKIGGLVDDAFKERNIFSAFQEYHKISYSHNNLVDMMLRQFRDDIDDLLRTEKLLLQGSIIPPFLEKDRDIFTVSWTRTFDKQVDGSTYSLYLSRLNELRNRLVNANQAFLNLQYPRGIPGITDSFLLEDATDWLQQNLGGLPKPFVGYFHFLPPHSPYRTHRDFYEYFKGDKFIPTEKRSSVFSFGETPEELLTKRTEYDEFILYADREFGRLFEYLETSGLLDDTWVILTSDHGEMFERGISEHVTSVLYEPVIHIPLMIFEPGRKTRLDVHTPTSAVDILPTLLHVTGRQVAGWTEGVVIPPFSDPSSSTVTNRNIYVLEAKGNEKYAPLTTATGTMIREDFKLMYFFGYKELNGGELVELYHLKNDPEELNDLSSSKPETASELLAELKQKLADVDEPYM